MLSKLALGGCILIIAWLFIRDRQSSPMKSWGLWVALLWAVILGSRYISAWFGVDIERESPDALLDGNPLDRNVFLILIIAGAVALYRRRPDWRKILESNRWFFAFFIYCGISVVWSDYPFVGMKRWVKELGNVIMVLLILTEADPVQATKAVFSRYVYLVIPLSIVLIYFFPQIGVYVDEDKLAPLFGGVTTNKNKLGVIALVSAMFLIWDLLHSRNGSRIKVRFLDLLVRGTLLIMALWLIYAARSATALVCVCFGTLILLFMRLPFLKRQVSYVGTYSLGLGILGLFIYFSGTVHDLLEILGRDATLTGRTDMWVDLLDEKINPLVGTGYQSFWLGPRAETLWEKYYFHPMQAHNGYLETYLNGGLVGMSLLLMAIAKTGTKLKGAILHGSNFGILLFAFLTTAILYNCTEAMFSRHSLLWILLSIGALYSPPPHDSVRQCL